MYCRCERRCDCTVLVNARTGQRSGMYSPGDAAKNAALLNQRLPAAPFSTALATETEKRRWFNNEGDGSVLVVNGAKL